MVKQVQLIEEFYDDDDDDLIFYPPSYYESDEQLVLIACLMLLEQRYRLLVSMTPQDIVDEIDDIMDSLLSELNDTALNKVDSTVYDSFIKELTDYSIPVTGYVEQDTSLYDTMTTKLEGVINQLKFDLKSKAQFFNVGLSKDSFNISPNFKRAIMGINDAVGNNLLYSKEKSHRNILKFVYGEEKLYRWRHMNDSKVCDWCIAQAKKAPRRIDDWELDHPHGRCGLEQVDDVYSDEYYSLLGGMSL